MTGLELLKNTGSIDRIIDNGFVLHAPLRHYWVRLCLSQTVLGDDSHQRFWRIHGIHSPMLFFCQPNQRLIILVWTTPVLLPPDGLKEFLAVSFLNRKYIDPMLPGRPSRTFPWLRLAYVPPPSVSAAPSSPHQYETDCDVPRPDK